MKRMHINVGVENLDQSIKFYSALFGEQPVKVKSDYAKWMVEDPRINFAITTRSGKTGVDHLGLQVEEDSELEELRERLKQADLSVFDEGETVCCYARSDKTWVQDPSGIAWEAYKTMEDVQLFSGAEKAVIASGATATTAATAAEETACCTPETKGQPGCCEPSEKTVGCCN